MARIQRLTMTYKMHIQLAPYSHVDAGLEVELEPDPEDGPEALRDLARLFSESWEVVRPSAQLQVRAAFEAFDDLQLERRERYARAEQPARALRAGASHTPTEPEPAREKQLETIAGLKASLGWADEELAAFAGSLGVTLTAMSRAEAQGLIQALHQQPRRRATGAPAPTGSDAEPPFPAASPPQSPEEAERRFYARYSKAIGGGSLEFVRTYLGDQRLRKPQTVAEWIALAERVRDRVHTSATA